MFTLDGMRVDIILPLNQVIRTGDLLWPLLPGLYFSERQMFQILIKIQSARAAEDLYMNPDHSLGHLGSAHPNTDQRQDQTYNNANKAHTEVAYS